MQRPRQLRILSGVAYGLAMLISGGYCVALSASTFALALGVAALSTIAGAALGYGFGGWYAPTGTERPTFELVATPLVVSLIAPIIGAFVFLLAGGLASGAETGELLWAAPAAVAMTLGYFSVTWPVALGVFALAGLAMAHFSRRGSNNAFNRTPLRGAG